MSKYNVTVYTNIHVNSDDTLDVVFVPADPAGPRVHEYYKIRIGNEVVIFLDLDDMARLRDAINAVAPRVVDGVHHAELSPKAT